MRRILPLLLLLLLFLFFGCSQLDKATNIISNPSAKEKYQREYNISDELYSIWEEQAALAFNDSIQVELPYIQAGQFRPKNFQIYSYNLNLNEGENLEIAVGPDSINHPVFIDLYKIQNDSLQSFEKIQMSKYGETVLSAEIKEPGIYKVVIQPGIETHTEFSLQMKKSSIYKFPVAGGNNRNVQSFWGAARDGGRRSHEGVDIFAQRGTPVVAVTDGRITSSGEKGLGGKQVWLRDTKRGQSLYYAHLDSIAILKSTRVKTGDTIGFVGNTGNAITTAPHLHFGIYKGYRGAVNPLPHIYQYEEPNFKNPEVPESSYLVTNSTANLRNRPAVKNSTITDVIKAQDTVQLLGKANEWYHIRTNKNQAAFIHESLVNPL